MTDEIDQLLDTAARFLDNEAPLTRLRGSFRNGSKGFSRDVWRKGAELGLTGLMVPESAGGFGFGAAAASAVIELCGRRLAPEPFLSSVCLAVPVLSAAATSRAVELMEGIASGELVVAVAVPGSADLGSARPPAVSVTRENDGWRLRGTYHFVMDAPQADWVLAPAAYEGGEAWFALRITDFQRVDGVLMDGRQASRLTIDARVEQPDLLAVRDQAHGLTEAVLTVGAALVAAWLLGVGEGAAALTLEHLRTRKQFGVAIGSFQALQHRMAILHCELAVTRAACDAAARAIDAGSADAALLASGAKARAGAAAELAGAEGIQLHGAMGMTDEADIGFFYKAARLGELTAGHRYFHKHRAAGFLGVQIGPVLPQRNADA